MLTQRDISVVRAVCRYFVLSRQQIQQLCFPDDREGRTTRRRLQTLVSERYIQRHQIPIPLSSVGPHCPVYFPGRRGCEFLSELDDDPRWLGVATNTPQPHLLFHWLAITNTHIALRAALKRLPQIACEAFCNEWDVLNPAAQAPEERFRLYTLIQEQPRLVCAPDAAFTLTVAGHQKVFYLEQDRNTSGVRQVAASKWAGYVGLKRKQLHRHHFPETTLSEFDVLCVVPTIARREALRKAIAEKDGAQLWRFAVEADLTPDRFLVDPIWHTCDGRTVPLIRPEILGPLGRTHETLDPSPLGGAACSPVAGEDVPSNKRERP